MAVREARVDAAVTEVERLRQAVDQMQARQEQVQFAALDARRLAHGINNDVTVIVGLLDTLQAGAELTTEHRADIEDAQRALGAMTIRFKAMHDLVRKIAPGPLPPELPTS